MLRFRWTYRGLAVVQVMEKSSKRLVNRLVWAGLAVTASVLVIFSIPNEISCNAGTDITPPQHQHHDDSGQACESNAEPDRRQKQTKKLWASKSWKEKVDSFGALFEDLLEDGLLSHHAKVMCISAGVGQEVMALRQMGFGDAVGIEVVESPPLVIRGDPHHHPFADNTFDLEFSSHISDALFPTRFVSEMERTLRPGGLSVIVISPPPVHQIIAFFSNSQLLQAKNITLLGLPSTQLVFKKKNL